MANNSISMTRARTNKADEFYTSYEDIQKEVESYSADIWKDKIIYLPCDNPDLSNFWFYFKDNIDKLLISELRATYLGGDKVTILKNKEITTASVKSGDFKDNKDLMLTSDIIVTNPPFSLFLDFMSQVISTKKKFLILGNVNSITNKDIFSLMMTDKLWFGSSIHAGDREFRVPDNYPLTAAGTRVDELGNKFVRVKGVRWFTNIDYPNRYQKLNCTGDIKKLQKFDNYDAVNIGFVKDIPNDYDGVMGVPITFMDKYNPDQFKLLGLDIMMPDNPRPNKRFLFNGKETYARIMIKSKPLMKPDISAFELHKEIFQDQPTAAINFDALFYHPVKGYVIIEYLLCEESQAVTPWTSHPNRYWYKNWRKFVSLFNATKKLNGNLLLINYAKSGTMHHNEVKIIRVDNCDKNNGITEQQEYKITFDEFKRMFTNFNRECLKENY